LLTLDEEVEAQLGQISYATLGRIITRLRQDEPRLPQRRGRASPSSSIQAAIPVQRIRWDEREPGHFEVDTVHHCGSRTRGDYVCSLQWIDVATGWSERAALYGRSEQETVQAFQRLVARCPIPIREIHTDNGSEFMNAHLVRYFQEQVTGAQLSRSRPYHKNDNRFVEQKNYTLIRAYLGDVRLDTREQAAQLDRLYGLMGDYYNLYQPTLHQKDKIVLTDEQGQVRVRRRHEPAQTPWQRLQALGKLEDAVRAAWQAKYDALNPLSLREEIERQLDALFATTA
jgi:transposase InsO family protein